MGVGEDLAVDDVFDLLHLGLGDAGEVGEVEAEAVLVDEGAGLLDVLAQDLAEGGVQEMGAGVVALGGGAVLVVDGGVDLVADCDRLEGEDLVGEDALHGLGRAPDFGDRGVVVGRRRGCRCRPLLAAGVGVEGGGVEDDFALFFGEQGLNADAVLDEREDAGPVDAEGGVTLELGLLEVLIEGVGGLLGAALPGGSGAGLFFFFGGPETFSVEHHIFIACGIRYEVFGKPIGFKEMEGGRP